LRNSTSPIPIPTGDFVLAQSTQREKVAAKEEAILDAAHAVFSESGVDGAKVSVIAQRAGVALGTIYLYYKNKAELLDAVVARFWQRLTQGARDAVSGKATALEQIDALAHYHLSSILADMPFVGLTSIVRIQPQADSHHISHVREYVRVFDQIISRATDRGDLTNPPPLWQMRDLFYGSLEYMARTLDLNQKTFDSSAVTNLTRVFQHSFFGASEVRTTVSASAADQILARLDRIEAALTPKRIGT